MSILEIGGFFVSLPDLCKVKGAHILPISIAAAAVDATVNGPPTMCQAGGTYVFSCKGKKKTHKLYHSALESVRILYGACPC